ncbi:MAG TPA: DUF4412 domain-containing protein [Gammaproteobacteria bacterium]|nr:DUF4412 domain-containing protein [Xanthomonadales bacterium]MCB1593526.1 DUF4412 domain-containing protein [Xanthomonadales bacterium]HOP21738.1 DUF4412 domain-containing protein [Gammaproteobacteria bacterium]HPI95427.1 DUF4412 domain-containing protein [Gammaproteobacteria bacterium]HPQ86644.1 DUF4412 domain-containing protein [Gammaproteobacteria bacterium]
MKFLKVCLLTATASSAFADTTLTYSTTDGDVTMIMQFANGMMRADSFGKEADSYMVYNSNNTTFTMIMKDNQQYFVLDKEQLESLGDMSAMMDKMLEKQMAQIPESQRAMMRGMMEQALKAQMPKKKPKAEYSLTGESDSVNGFDCEVVVKKGAGGKSDFCVADYSEVGMSSSEYAVISSFQKTIEAMAEQFGEDNSMDFSGLGDFIPVRYNQSSESGVLSDVNHDSISPENFSIPQGYKKVEMPF